VSIQLTRRQSLIQLRHLERNDAPGISIERIGTNSDGNCHLIGGNKD
jgi:hypothetical protein